MRIVFAGTPEFAARALEALLAAGHEVPLVLTQPERPAGRGMRPAASAVKRLALERELAVLQPRSLKAGEAAQPIRAAGAQAMVVAAYGLILPAAVLESTSLGALNIHASLLPRWRGAAPIQRAILAGDRETGVTIMRMDAGLDTGPMLERRAIAIEDCDDAGTLHDKLATLGAELIVTALDKLAAGTARTTPQPAEGVTYARKIEKHETVLDWAHPASELSRAVRAFRPSPGATTTLAGEVIKIWRATESAGAGAPGEVLSAGSDGIAVACGTGALVISELQRAGGKRLSAADFLPTQAPGTRFATVRSGA